MRLPNIVVINVEVVFKKKAIWGFTWWPSTKELTTSWWKRGKIWLLKTSKKWESVNFANNPLEATLPWKTTSLRSTRLAASVKQPFLSPKIWRSAERSTQHVKSAILMRTSPPSWRDICKAMPRLSQFQSPTSPSNLSSNALFTYVSSFCCPVFGGQCFLFSPLIFSSIALCTYVSKPRCVQIQIFFVCLFHQLSRHKDHFVMTTITPHAPNLYWNYVLGYEHDFCHDIDQPPQAPPSHPLCIGIMY